MNATPHYRVNFVFLIQLLLGGAILAVGLYFLHGYQLKQISAAFLSKARDLREAETAGDAILFYNQHLKLTPQSTEARKELGELFVELGNLPGAYRELEGALRINPDFSSARESLVDVAMDLGRHSDAKLHLVDHLLPSDPKRADWHWELGQCEAKGANWEEAKASFEKAVELDPKKPEYAISLARLLTERFGQTTESKVLMDKLVENAPDDFNARLARGRWYWQIATQELSLLSEDRNQMLQVAREEAMAASSIDPESPKSVLLYVDTSVALDNFDNCELMVQQSIEKNPKVSELYGAAAQIRLTQGDRAGAIAQLKNGISELPGDTDLLFDLCQLLVDSRDLAAAEGVISELQTRKFVDSAVDYLKGRLLAARGDWREAVIVLEKARPAFDRQKDFLRQVDYLLAVCYENLNDTDLEIEAYRRAMTTDQNGIESREGLARALLRVGRLQEAMLEYEQLCRLPQSPLRCHVYYARLLFLDGIRRGAAGEQWNELNAILSQLDTQPEAKVETNVLRAELLAFRGEAKESLALLDSLLSEAPATKEFHQTKIAIHIRNEDWDAVEVSLEEAKKAIGDVPMLRLEMCRYLVQRFGESVDRSALEELGRAPDTWTESEKVEMAAGVSQIFLSLKDAERGKRFAKFVAMSPQGAKNLAVHLVLFDLANLDDDLETMDQSIAQIRGIEGIGPYVRVGQAIRLGIEADKLPASDSAGREQLHRRALDQLTEAAVLRPSWYRIPRLKGELFDREQKDDLAIQSYLQAIGLGEQNPEVISRLVYLLYKQKRFVEADDVVRRLQQSRVPFSSDLTKLATQISMELENFDRALSLAQDSAEQQDQQSDHLWLAQVYRIAGKNELAEKEFSEAISKDPSISSPWVAKVQFLASLGRDSDAREAIQGAQQAVGLKEKDESLAECYFAIKDFSNAEKYFRRSIEQNPKSVSILKKFIEFCLSTNQLDEAESALRQMVQARNGNSTDRLEIKDSDLAWSRNTLARLLISRGLAEFSVAERAKESLSLIRLNETDYGLNNEEQRSLAVVYGSLPDRQSVTKAIGYLEQVVRSEPFFSIQDHLDLARLYRRSGDWQRYCKTMRSVLGKGGASQVDLVREYATALVENGEFNEAQLWFSQLKKLAPMNTSTLSVEAKLLFGAGDYKRLLQLLDSASKRPGELEWAASAADAAAADLDGMNKSKESEQFKQFSANCWQQLVLSDPSKSESRIEPALRQGDIRPLVRFVQENDSLGADQWVRLANIALQSGKLTKESAIQLLSLWKPPGGESSLDSMMLQADLWSWAENVTQAAGLYERVLMAAPNHVPAMNNLAMVLALSGSKLANAEVLVDMAISKVGETDYLLDTRGAIRLAKLDFLGAESDFKSLAEMDPKPDRLFHLARLYNAMSRSEDAKKMFESAIERGLVEESLHPLERKSFRELRQKLGAR